MSNGSNHWFELGEPASPAEREALAKVRALLPSNASTYAWANLTTIDLRGRTDEIDVLLLCRRGLFVVELKGWHGTIRGGQQTWAVRGQTGRHERTERNPLLLTDAKARRLASLLKDKAPGRSRSQLPFISGLVVLHGQDSRVELDELGRTRVYALDDCGISGLPEDQTLGRFLESGPDDETQLIDANRAKHILKIIQAAGLRPTPKVRMVGQYALERADPLADGPDWRDVLAHNPSVERMLRRIRLFDIPPGASSERRQEIERAAQRAVTLTQGLDHPGIERPLDLISTDSGPALLYNYDPTALPIDVFLHQREVPLTLDERMDLIRQVGEALVYAHDRRLAHRGLTPRQVYVSETEGRRQVKIRDWHTARRSPDEQASSTATALSRGAADPRSLVHEQGWVYLAPEAHPVLGSGEDLALPTMPLDVYGFGSLAYLILTGAPPAQTLADLNARLSEGGLNPQRDAPGLSDDFAEAVLSATAFSEGDRTPNVAAVLDALEDARRELDASSTRESAVDPLEATEDQEIGDRFIVKDRRGSGSTGVALCVDDFGDPVREGVILKIANDEDAGRRLSTEAEVLRTLESPRIVRLHDGPFDVGGRQALLLSDAGKETLATRLTNDGRATLEQLDTFGADLFEAVAHLDGRGVFHRDIKPANLGVTADPSTRRPRLVLFDFSLSREPLRHTSSGTRRYLDPYLRLRKRGQFDRAAELYAVAVTLFEMATNEVPWWAEGSLAPATADDRVVLNEAMFDASVAADLVRFFAQALAPDATERFGGVTEMAASWGRVFARLTTESADSAASQAELDADADRASLTTPLSLAGLSPHALSALERLPITTVGDLLATSPMRINSIPGLGETHRREVQQRIRQWRGRLHSAQAEPTTTQVLSTDRSVDAVLQRLVPKPNRDNGTKVASLRLMFGIPTAVAADSEEQVTTDSSWPTLSKIAKQVGVTPGRVSQLLDQSARRWGRILEAAPEELSAWLETSGGVGTLAEAAHLMLQARGSTAEGPARLRLASGLVRAVYEHDARQSRPRFTIRRRRSDGTVLLALESGREGNTGHGLPAAEALLDYAGRLGARADGLVDGEAVVAAGRARSALQSVPTHGIRLGGERMLRLATGASQLAALSGRGEIYRQDLSGADAVRQVLASLPMRDVAAGTLRRRARERFPRAGTPPEGLELDSVVRDVFPEARRENDDTYTFRRRSHSDASSQSVYTRVTTPGLEETDRLLRESLRSHSALTLAVHPRRYDAAALGLVERYGVRHVDVATDLVRAVRETAEAKRVDWHVVRAADAHPADSLDGSQLRRLVHLAYDERWASLLDSPDPLLLTGVAPLLRYGFDSKLSDLLDLGTRRSAARWVLVPRLATEATPRLDGALVPLGPAGWVDLPEQLADRRPAHATGSEKVPT